MLFLCPLTSLYLSLFPLLLFLYDTILVIVISSLSAVSFHPYCSLPFLFLFFPYILISPFCSPFHIIPSLNTLLIPFPCLLTSLFSLSFLLNFLSFLWFLPITLSQFSLQHLNPLFTIPYLLYFPLKFTFIYLSTSCSSLSLTQWCFPCPLNLSIVSPYLVCPSLPFKSQSEVCPFASLSFVSSSF